MRLFTQVVLSRECATTYSSTKGVRSSMITGDLGEDSSSRRICATASRQSIPSRLHRLCSSCFANFNASARTRSARCVLDNLPITQHSSHCLRVRNDTRIVSKLRHLFGRRCVLRFIRSSGWMDGRGGLSYTSARSFVSGSCDTLPAVTQRLFRVVSLPHPLVSPHPRDQGNSGPVARLHVSIAFVSTCMMCGSFTYVPLSDVDAAPRPCPGPPTTPCTPLAPYLI